LRAKRSNPARADNLAQGATFRQISANQWQITGAVIDTTTDIVFV